MYLLLSMFFTEMLVKSFIFVQLYAIITVIFFKTNVFLISMRIISLGFSEQSLS